MTDDSDNSPDRKARLERIAHELGQPVINLFVPVGPPSLEAETLVLLKAFTRIEDRQARARCLAFVEAESERSARD